ncbi:putative zinc knuckle, partial [Dipodascopsis tothii]|uniref:putative zinc knuckle n=1 Tax=Dipodascopsis tothii TaxID=44089 RepID=UPI0034CF7CED
RCGNIGHFAEVCSSPERLCYNCKQPGHESNACPHPRTTETKQCYHCQGLGHVQADCPTLRLSGALITGRCYTCGQPGHVARNCLNVAAAAAPPGFAYLSMNAQALRGIPMRTGLIPRISYIPGNGRTATCYKCGGPNHYARDCQAQAMKCYACGKLGHISRDCTAPNGGPLSTAGKTCYRCGELGHIVSGIQSSSDKQSRECPQNGGSPTGSIVDSSNGTPVGSLTSTGTVVTDSTTVTVPDEEDLDVSPPTVVSSITTAVPMAIPVA